MEAKTVMNGMNGHSRLWLQVVTIVMSIIIVSLIGFYFDARGSEKETIATLEIKQYNLEIRVDKIEDKYSELIEILTDVRLLQTGIQSDIKHIKDTIK